MDDTEQATRDGIEMVASLAARRAVVEFGPDIRKEVEWMAAPGTRARIVGFAYEARCDDWVMEVDFEEFDEHNVPLWHGDLPHTSRQGLVLPWDRLSSRMRPVDGVTCELVALHRAEREDGLTEASYPSWLEEVAARHFGLDAAHAPSGRAPRG